MVVNWRRALRHMFSSPRTVRRYFTDNGLEKIEQAIVQSETQHTGQVCFAVEHALDGWPVWRGQSARERAIEVFARLRVWDTEQNNGVLIYLLLADRDVEIVADRGIHTKVGTEAWENLCHDLEHDFRQGRYTEGIVAGIHAITLHLVRHFPALNQNIPNNELPNRPVIL